jgi:hypothetical protein
MPAPPTPTLSAPLGHNCSAFKAYFKGSSAASAQRESTSDEGAKARSTKAAQVQAYPPPSYSTQQPGQRSLFSSRHPHVPPGLSLSSDSLSLTTQVHLELSRAATAGYMLPPPFGSNLPPVAGPEAFHAGRPMPYHAAMADAAAAHAHQVGTRSTHTHTALTHLSLLMRFSLSHSLTLTLSLFSGARVCAR